MFNWGQHGGWGRWGPCPPVYMLKEGLVEHHIETLPFDSSIFQVYLNYYQGIEGFYQYSWPFPLHSKFERDKFITIAGNSIPKLVRLGSLVAKYRRVWKISPRVLGKFCINRYYARKSLTTFRNSVNWYFSNTYHFPKALNLNTERKFSLLSLWYI